jgi:hypothetical protein
MFDCVSATACRLGLAYIHLISPTPVTGPGPIIPWQLPSGCVCASPAVSRECRVDIARSSRSGSLSSRLRFCSPLLYRPPPISIFSTPTYAHIACIAPQVQSHARSSSRSSLKPPRRRPCPLPPVASSLSLDRQAPHSFAKGMGRRICDACPVNAHV